MPTDASGPRERRPRAQLLREGLIVILAYCSLLVVLWSVAQFMLNR